jgi:putative ABC transport system substrate-binding protein
MAATSAVPIVMLLNNDPVAAGFVASLARPEGNVTGVTGSQPGTDLKRLQLLAESAPGISKVAVLGDPADPAFWEPAVRTLGIELLFESVAPEGFEATVARIATRADALLVRPGQSAATNQPVIGAATARSALPGISQSRSFVAAGGLMAYEVRAADMDRRAADYVDRLLRGARPADLPVEQATRYDLIVNLATARALGLTLSPAFLARVDEIIE